MTDQGLTVTSIVQNIEFHLGIGMKEELSLPLKYVQFKPFTLLGSSSSGLQCVWYGVVWCGIVWYGVV